MPASKSDSHEYWCSAVDSEECAGYVLERIKRYRDSLRDSGRSQRMVRSWNAFYGFSPTGDGDTSMVGSSGDEGEFVDVTTNDYATLVTQTVVMTTANKPAFRAVATNADSGSMAQASFGQALLEAYDKKQSLSDRDYEAALTGTMLSEGWAIYGWDASAGRLLTEFDATGPRVHEGDIHVQSATPFDVAYDPDAMDLDSLEWFAFRRRYNRFSEAAKIQARDPETARMLREMGDDKEAGEDLFDVRSRNSYTRSTSSDLIWVWEMRHLPTPALPNGRLIRFVSDSCVLFDSIEENLDPEGNPIAGSDGLPTFADSGYPYDELHAYRLSPESQVGNVAGHAPAFDLLGLQEMIDTIVTMAASAANAGGISNMWTKTGDKPTLSQLAGSMNFIQSANKPEMLQGVELSAQVPALEGLIEKRMLRRLGQSDVSMGSVPSGMPGNLAALLEAKTVQFHSRLQASYAKMLERSRTGLLKILKRYAKTKRVAVLGGVANGWKLKEWCAEDLSGVDRFTVESVNPMTQTFAGKQETAKELLSHGLVSTAQQYLTLLDTGRLEPLLESGQSNMMRIRKEKEMLEQGIGLPPVDPGKSFAAGAPVFVDDGRPHIRPLMIDTPWLDIPECKAVVDMPGARDNPAIVSAVTGVVEEKLRMLKLMDPVLMAVLKCPPDIVNAVMMSRQPMGPPMGGPPSPGAPPPNGPGRDPASPPDAKLPATPGLPAGAPHISAARPPRDPITGAQAPSPIVAPGAP